MKRATLSHWIQHMIIDNIRAMKRQGADLQTRRKKKNKQTNKQTKQKQNKKQNKKKQNKTKQKTE